MRLGFHYHIPAQYEGGRIKMPGYLGRFVDSLAENCDSVVCFLHSPTSYELPQMDYTIESENVELVDLGPHNSVPKRVLRSRKIKRIISSFIQSNQKLDAMLIRAPTPMISVVAKAIKNTPISLLVVADNTFAIDELAQPKWRKEMVRLFENWNKHTQIKMAKNSLTFVNSHSRYLEYKSFLPYVVETRTTTLRESDFFEREDTCTSKPFRLLFAGRLDRAKGLFDIVEAIVILVNQGNDVVLDLVGWPEKEDLILEELSEFAKLNGISDRLNYHGYKAVGPELFDYYKNADIFVVASRSSFEGFPRSIWEAMAHSLPVVATRVSSIPALIEGSAVLAPPRNVQALASAIARIINQPELRQRYIKRGLDLAHDNTIEIQTEKMMAKINAWLGVRHA